MSFLEGGSYLDKFRSFEMLLKEFIYRAEHLFQNRLIPCLHALKNDACSLFRRNILQRRSSQRKRTQGINLHIRRKFQQGSSSYLHIIGNAIGTYHLDFFAIHHHIHHQVLQPLGLFVENILTDILRCLDGTVQQYLI